MKPLAHGLLLGGLLLGRPAAAQTSPAESGSPCLSIPGPMSGVGRQTVELAIYQRIIFPPECLRDEVSGRVFIELTITPAGSVQQVVLVKGLVEPFDRAVVKAARQLYFCPRPVKEGAVSFAVGISWEKEGEWLMASKRRPARKPTPHRNPKP